MIEIRLGISIQETTGFWQDDVLDDLLNDDLNLVLAVVSFAVISWR